MTTYVQSISYGLNVRALTIKLLCSIKKWCFVWIFGLALLFIAAHFFTIGFNVSESLPNNLFIVMKRNHEIRRGDYMAFRWHGGGPYVEGVSFTKIVVGLPGDVVSWQGRNVFINGQLISTAKTHAKTGQQLNLGPSGVIPNGYYYVHTPNVDSLDSRYAITGWIKKDAVIGKAVPLL
jgi:conjugal transfer pilin signal peptidase TrbI